MKVNIFNLNGEQDGDIKLPRSFEEEIRPDIIHKAVTACRANRRQPYGPSKNAGMRHSVEERGRGRGMSRVQRMKQYGNRAAESPNNVGGRRAHPPLPEKDLSKKINRKEKSKARRSALAATANEEIVKNRGHAIDNDDLSYPIVLDSAVEEIEKTKDAIELLKKLGIYNDVERSKNGKRIRPGKGKRRNRKYRQPVSMLVMLPKGCKGINAFSNLPGVTVKYPHQITVEDLAPGGDMGRLVLISENAIRDLEDW